MELIKDLHTRGISRVYMVEQVQFKDQDTYNYIDIFNELKNDGYIIADTYNDTNWKIPCFTTNQYINLLFDIEIYRELNQALRMYSIILLAKGKSTYFIYSTILCLKKLIMISNGFLNPEQLEKYLLNPSNTNAYFMARVTMNFIDFYPAENPEQYQDICHRFSESERNIRELPLFMDILIFDESINDYFRQSRPHEELLRYKPIQLWWAITNIIPMRPNDFLKLKNNCIEKAEDGTFWITVPRSKKKKESVRDIGPTQTIQISKEIFDLIKEFQLILSVHRMDSKYLFNQKYYRNFSTIRFTRSSKVVEDRWNRDQFGGLLRHFHQKVLSSQYQETLTIELLPSHTRHLAIINLFLQGFNLLSIAQMAGHSELNSPSHYYTHAENFVQSYVYNLLRTGISENIGRNFSDGFIGWRRTAVDTGKLFSFEESKNKFRSVDYGFCKDDSFPNNCGEDCRPCPYFIFKPSINEHEKAMQWLEGYSELLQQQSFSMVQSMIATSKAISSNIRPDLDESLRSKSRQLQQLMDHSVSLELIKMGEMSNEE